jgi:serine/threonine protein kinase
MNHYPDFSDRGYRVVRELGCNRTGGRLTYLATTSDDRDVAIKEFCFARSHSNWTGYKAYEREIEVLRQLNHPRIPQYLDAFETEQGFCLVQEYKDAPSLAAQPHFNPAQVPDIAISLLEILADLQNRQPPMIHRDIKPENILVDDRLNVYLIDFGLARLQDEEVSASSMAVGTPGFMPPEELFNRELTTASDLYSLGATLVCLLTQTRSTGVGKLVGDDYRFNLQRLLPDLNPRLRAWLQQMTAPNIKERYANATVALEALLAALQPQALVQQKRGTLVLGKTAAAASLAVGLVGIGFGIRSLVAQPPYPVIVPPPPAPYPVIVPPPPVPYPVIAPPPPTHIAPKPAPILEKANPPGRPGMSCAGCNLVNANFEGQNLSGANLEGANLEGANLKGANLQGANLERANLDRANLEGANLQDASLARSANLSGANLKGVNFQRATLSNADFSGANLEGANFGEADLSFAQLMNVNLKGVNFDRANLEGANLERSNLEGVNLNGANLEEAIFPPDFKREF